ncbi:MAG: histone deacetylase [Syntrophomonadaceae bacterium]|nr:histone deacetylase [Syntrophomonadaceae bacterium]
MKPTGLVFFPAFDWAISPTHPEREERLLYTRDQIFEEGIMDLPQITEYQPQMATDRDVARTHFCVPTVRDQATDAHRISCGGALTIADALMRGEIRNGFALVRPPGHHSMRVSHGNRGFCNINNEAIMVDYLRHRYNVKRIAIVDTDVHHGDGTQEIFWHDPDVLFISFHQDGRTLYPGTGFTNEIGGPLAQGYTLNVPLPPGTGDQGILYVLDHLVLPVLKEFNPELVVNSAGQDNHYTDPLANMRFTARGYAELNRRLAPDIAVLEGGYSVETALPYINMGIIMAMAGIDYQYLYEPDYDPGLAQESRKGMEIIKQIIEVLQKTWRDRDKLVENARNTREKFYQRHKYIYYDTDNVREQQLETLRLCPTCPGYLTIDSLARFASGFENRVCCVSIPWQACPICVRDANEHYEAIKKRHDRHEFIYLQDKSNDRFLRYECQTRKEFNIE